MVTKPTLPFNPEEIKPSTAKKVVDGLGRSVRQFHYNAAENILEHEDDLVHVSSYDMKSKEPKIGSREHKFKNPEKYVSTYTSSLEQAAFPIPGTAPSEVAAAKKILNESGPVTYDKRGYPSKASPEAIGRAAANIERMRQMTGEPNQPKIKKINAYSEVKIPIPTINYSLLRNSAADVAKAAAIEKVRQYAFLKRPDPDITRGVGSFANTIGKKLRQHQSKKTWEQNHKTIYEDNSNG